MKYSRKAIVTQYEQGDRLKFLFFWGHQPSPDGAVTSTCFSQWYLSPFEVDGITYPTAEHWMMAEKARLFQDHAALQKILVSKTPAEAKEWGRNVLHFDQDIWEEKRLDIVIKGNYHKFAQHPALQEYLIGTKQRILVEASPVDSIWGIGLPRDHTDAANPTRWIGLNLLGFALMEVRDWIIEVGNSRN